jgi:molybdenum cofactor guanylyltransferase
VLAVDLPFVNAKDLQYLIKRARSSPALAVVPRSGEGWQPLCAVYRKGFKDCAERSLLQGKNKIDALFAQIDVLAIAEPELVHQGSSREIFRNLNTLADLDQARKQRMPSSD